MSEKEQRASSVDVLNALSKIAGLSTWSMKSLGASTAVIPTMKLRVQARCFRPRVRARVHVLRRSQNTLSQTMMSRSHRSWNEERVGHTRDAAARGSLSSTHISTTSASPHSTTTYQSRPRWRCRPRSCAASPPRQAVPTSPSGPRVLLYRRPRLTAAGRAESPSGATLYPTHARAVRPSHPCLPSTSLLPLPRVDARPRAPRR